MWSMHAHDDKKNIYPLVVEEQDSVTMLAYVLSCQINIVLVVVAMHMHVYERGKELR